MVDLTNVGNTQLGKSGAVNLTELNSSDAETRVFTTYGYLRVNRFEIADGDAPTPSGSAPHNLSDWEGYVQWTASRATGANLDCTGKDWDHLNFSWTRPTDYTSFPQAEVRQQLWCVACSPNTQAGCEDDDPLSGTAYATTDGTSGGTGNVLNHLTWYLCAVYMDWDDDGDAGWERQSNGYAPDATLSNGAVDNVDSIIVRTNNTTTTTPACTPTGQPCTGCPTNPDCCTGWCDQFGGGCQDTEPDFC